MNSNLKQLINLSCDKVEHGQAPGMLVIHFKDFKLNIECSWVFRNSDGSTLSNDEVQPNKDALPNLKGSSIVDIKYLGGNLSDMQLSFDNDSVLEIKQDDMKYEAWQLYKDDKLILVVGPNGDLSEFK